ncbi:MAG: PAS domain S-box protein [Burkholderiales bacterium]|nr:PAS domain S-box protein [Burkholderiales bacterium]
MVSTLLSMLGRNGLLPHGYCFAWSPGLLWPMVGSDAVIAAAYFSIPLAIVSYVRRRPDQVLHWVAWLFSAFIFACGLTHVMDIWTVWHPAYGLQALTKVLTAGVSLATAVALWPLIPRALKIPSVRQLQSAIERLEAEAGRRRGAEEQLAQIQQSLAVTLASIDAGFIATDRSGRVTRLNSVAERITGWSEAEARGRPLWEVYTREDRPADHGSQNPVDLLFEQGISVDTAQHVVVVARDGTRTPIEVKAAPMHDDDGVPSGLAMVLRDLTQQARAEAEASRLAAIVESSSDAIISKTLEGTITSWNRAAERMFGYRADEAVGQPIQMLIPPEYQAEEIEILARLARGQAVPAFDAVRRRRNGELIDVSIAISPIRDAQGRIVGASKSARDVTQQRRAEAALRESEARLRFALESAQIGDWELDLQTLRAQTSLRHNRCFGHTEPQSAWGVDRFLAQVHPEDRPQVAQGLQAAIAERRGWAVECRVVWPDDSVHWISAHASVQQQPGRPDRMFGIVRDITQHKQAEQARLLALRLEAENRQVQESSRLKSQFLANMSHELRTPLNAIIGFADLLHAGTVAPDSPKHRLFLGHIGTSGRHLLQLINDVLDLSKVESGKFDFRPEPVALPRLVSEVLDILHTTLQAKRIDVAVSIGPGLDDLDLDPARLKQALYNYLSNAIKFSAADGRVAVRASAEGSQHFRLEVEDSGIGISAADLGRLFTEFQQLDAGYSKQQPGTGLGLALTRRLVQAQGGRVGVRSTLGVGSVFWLVLPRQPGRGVSPSSGLQGEGDPPRVLVVEHDLRTRQRLVDAFATAGFAADAASSGEQALSQARQTPYAALTLDLRLTDRPGLALLEGVRDHGASQAAPVIGLTLSATDEAVAAFGVSNLLCKPIRSDEILAEMSRFKRGRTAPPRVLVIDDDETARDLMCATLKSIGIEGLSFADGRLALDQLDRLQPDAIILDLLMPGFDGFEVLAALQALPAWRGLPVFVWTGMALSPGEYAQLARSARAVVGKQGVALDDLLERVRRWRPLLPASDSTFGRL